MITYRRNESASKKRNYDSFIEEKRRIEDGKRFGVDSKNLYLTDEEIEEANNPQMKIDLFGTDALTFGSYNCNVREPKQTVSKSDYTSYLLKQLNRTKPETLYSEEEFYQNKANAVFGKAQKSAADGAKAKGRLSKRGKIFVACYVLVAVVIASIILALA
jgi:hypothetical protein